MILYILKIKKKFNFNENGRLMGILLYKKHFFSGILNSTT